MAIKLYRFKTEQVAGVPNKSERRLDSERSNTKKWLKLGLIEIVKEDKKNSKK